MVICWAFHRHAWFSRIPGIETLTSRIGIVLYAPHGDFERPQREMPVRSCHLIEGLPICSA
jgi:hypothetical protein